MGIEADVQGFTTGQRISLYLIDFSTTRLATIPPPMYLYPGVKANYGNLFFGGNEYTPFPMEVTGFKESADGPLPRPLMTISNVQGFISQQMTLYNDFVGARVIRYTTFAKYLDGEPESDPLAKRTEIYFVEQKKAEDNQLVQFELISAIDIMDAKLPSRVMMTNTCMWVYKSTECSWTDNVGYRFDANDVPVADLADDVCGKTIRSCKCRFARYTGTNLSGGYEYQYPNTGLPYGAFPALGRTR